MSAMAAFVAVAAAPALAGVYGNARFGYSIAYPPELVPQPESENSDGRAFRSADGRVEALVWGAYNALDESPAQLAAEAERDCGAPPTYRRVTAAFFAISCAAGGRVFYEKMLIRGDTLTAFRITYPAADHVRWDRVTAQMSASLTPAR
jgi:hypothetical protein